MNPDWIKALVGGLVIGLAASWMLLVSGRVTGISGIFNGVLDGLGADFKWRLAFVLGLISGGSVLAFVNPESFTVTIHPSIGVLVFAGLLVGFGTILGSGCTSGHGVCGVSRLSIRSIIATCVFMAFGIATVWLVRVFEVQK